MDVRHRSAQNTILQKVFEEGIKLHVKHPGCQVRTATGFLPRPQLMQNLWPIWVACHVYEQVRFPKLSNQRHGILVELVHVAGATSKSGWKDHHAPKVSVVSPVLLHGIYHSFILVNTQGGLVEVHPPQPLPLNLGVLVNHPFLI